MNNNNNPSKKKIIILGIGGCGKTSLLNSIIRKPFEPKYLSNWNTEIIETNNFIFYDTAGQNLIPKMIHKNYDFALIVFSNTNRLSYSLIYKYIKILKNTPYLIVGTCSDLVKQRKIFDKKAINISNKTGLNVDIVQKNLINYFNSGSYNKYGYK